MIKQWHKWLLLGGDFLAMHLALILMILIKNPADFSAALDRHFWPFAFLNCLLILILYNFNFYSRQKLAINLKFAQTLASALGVGALFSMAFFYLGRALGITPKSNLLLFFIFFASLFIIWRHAAGRLIKSGARGKILMIDADPGTRRLFENRDLNLSCQFIQSPAMKKFLGERYDLIVVGRHSYPELQNQLYLKLFENTVIWESADFWEEYFRKIPMEQVGTHWLLSGLRGLDRREYETLKRAFDLVLAVFAGLFLSWLFPLIILAVKLFSPGPIFYHQKRVGKNEKVFTLHKFRSMINLAEQNGPQWSGQNDFRVTRLGKILRHTHLDELPQLWNILKNDMSFVGPRPERPEFIPSLKAQIPHYSLRHLVKPGLTGWAQINYRYGNSVADAKEKMAYDLYYVKNRSFLLDLKIILKTAAMLFRGEGR